MHAQSSASGNGPGFPPVRVLPSAPDRTGLLKMAGNAGGLQGTTRVMSHNRKRTRLGCMISTRLVAEVQTLKLWSPIVGPVLTFPGVVRPSTPKKTDYEP